MKPAPTKAKPDDVLVERVAPLDHGPGQAFAPRLETYWFTCTLQVKYAGPGPRRVGTTARYLVHARDPAQTVLGEIAWSGTQKSYTFAVSAHAGRFVAKALQDLSEICTYLTQRSRVAARDRQRRLKASGRTHA